jgi:hypothetical protein
MSNVFEFKKRPQPAEAALDPSLDPCKASSYSLTELLEFQYTDKGYIDEWQYEYTETPETHMRMVAYLDAFGFDYVIYRVYPQPFMLCETLGAEFSGDALMSLQHGSTWNLLRNRRGADHAAYVEAVARQDRDAIKRYRHVAEAKFQQEMAKRDPEGNLPNQRSYAPPAETTMFERGVQNLAWYSALDYTFPAFERTSSGEYRHEGHDRFLAFAYVCGWSYADISRDKMRLDEVSSICIGTLGYWFYQMHGLDGWRWNKAQAERTFAGCSEKLIRYLSACHGKRADSARKLRDAVWPELQEWARRNPFDRSVFGRG